MEKNFLRIQKIAYILIIVTISYLALIVFKKFFAPLVLGILVAYLLYPMAAFLENKLKFKRIFAILTSIFFSLFLVFIFIKLFSIQFNILAKDFPSIKEHVAAKLNVLQTFIETKTNYSIENQKIVINNTISNIFESSDKILGKIFSSASETLTVILFIPVFSAFMLYYRDRAKTFILKLAKEKNGRFTEGLLEEISKISISYMVGVLTVCAILAVFHSVFLVLIGAKYPIFLGILAASISIIPYFGTLASTVIPLTFSILISDNPYEPIWVVIYWLIINSVENNILTPGITGGNVNLNPFITILSLILGALVWGIPGMIVVIPIIGIFKIICDKVEGLEPYGYILGIDKKKIKFAELRKIYLKRKLQNENKIIKK
jgi:predicted PurR-regulated permease PerM